MQTNVNRKVAELEREKGRTYVRELLGSIAVYAAILVPSISYGPGMAEGWLRTAVLLSPMLGFLLMIWAVARHVARMDEYQRRVALETFAMAGAVTAGVTFTYGFLENAGYPRLSMFLVWGVMGCSWLVIGLLRCRFASR